MFQSCGTTFIEYNMIPASFPSPRTGCYRWLPFLKASTSGGYFLVKGSFPSHCSKVLAHRGLPNCCFLSITAWSLPDNIKHLGVVICCYTNKNELN